MNIKQVLKSRKLIALTLAILMVTVSCVTGFAEGIEGTEDRDVKDSGVGVILSDSEEEEEEGEKGVIADETTILEDEIPLSSPLESSSLTLDAESTVEQTTSLSLTVDTPEDIISVSIPSTLMLQMDANGKMIVPTTAKITNNTEGKGIEIQNIQIDLAGEWEYAAYSKEFQEGETNKQIALKLRSDEMDETGNVGLTADNWKVPADSSIDLTIDARIPKQTVSGTYNNLATISFTIGLSEGENGGGN